MYRGGLFFGLAVCLLVVFSASTAPTQTGRYVGSKSCEDCHAEEYERFSKYANKAHSDESVQLMASDLTQDEVETCYRCHATGYGKPGGFVSYEQTPDLGHAGCEVCHGPGYDHVDSGGDPELIKADLAIEDCEVCHNDPRVNRIRYKPVVFAGAH